MSDEMSVKLGAWRQRAIAGVVLTCIVAFPSWSAPLGGISPLSCDGLTTIRLPLDPSANEWPKTDLRFSCFPKRVEVTVSAVLSSLGVAKWSLLSKPLRAQVDEEGGFTLELPQICADATGAPGKIVGHLKWGGIGFGLRQCTRRSYAAIELQLRVAK